MVRGDIVAYFKIDGVDFSNLCNELVVQTNVNYNAQTNAAGGTVVDYVGAKRTITVGIVSVNDTDMLRVQQAISAFSVALSFRDPRTNMLAENVPCIIPSYNAEYYTIQVNNVRYKAMSLTFTEL
jgi:hypothetical protein